MEKETLDFISNFVTALKENNAVVFAGAGLSVETGFYDWKVLLEPTAERLGLDIREEHHLAALAQYLVDGEGGRGELNKIVVEHYQGLKVRLSAQHQILARLPIQLFWTTNFDNLIEQALVDVGKTPDVKKAQGDLSMNLPKRDAIVYKMHGDISSAEEAVVTRHDDDYNKSRELFSNAFKRHFITRTFLFIGFSFADPNLDYLISRIRETVGKKRRPGYYFLKRDMDAGIQHRNEIGANTLELYGLHPVWINDYFEIEEILKEIEIRYLHNSIFISGSADTYTPYTPEQGGQFLHDLSFAISSGDYKIVSGFGLGVGSAALNGVLDNLENRKNQNTDHYITMRPFPQFVTGARIIQERWKEYREKFMQLAGIVLFVFGNKHGGSTLANGMLQEFEIALSKGLKVIPIGSTGFMAEQLWKRVCDDFGTYYPNDPELKPSFESLGNKSLSFSEIIKVTVGIIDHLNSK